MGANTQSVNNLSGERGGNYVADTTETAGPFNCLWAANGDATFSDIDSNITGLPDTFVLLDGRYLHGNVSKFTLTSGTIVAYRSARQANSG